jgi:hypothetical protein
MLFRWYTLKHHRNSWSKKSEDSEVHKKNEVRNCLEGSEPKSVADGIANVFIHESINRFWTLVVQARAG